MKVYKIIGALIEGIFSNGFQAFREGQTGQTGTAIESMGKNGGQPLPKLDGLQCGTTIESVTVDL